MNHEILEKLVTPIVLLDDANKIVYENFAAVESFGFGESLIGADCTEKIKCVQGIVNIISEIKEGEESAEVFDPHSGIYWRVFVKPFELNGKSRVSLQFLNINMQKLAERKLFTLFEFTDEIKERINNMFENTLDAEFARSSRLGTHFAVVMYKIDDLEKHIEEEGIYQTNYLIHEIGRIWSENIRQYDYAPFYLDRNLFAVILIQVEKDTSQMVTEKIQKMIKEQTEATVSMGVAYSKETPSSNTLITLAQRALYVAGQKGGDNISMG
ncbi:MAG: diguanylate cyclase domain-containing protein [Candidatus Zixiibacteriota bacterium]